MIYVEKIRIHAFDEGEEHTMTIICHYYYFIIQYEDVQAIIEQGRVNLDHPWKLFEALTMFAKHEPEFIANVIRAMKGDSDAFDKIGLIAL